MADTMQTILREEAERCAACRERMLEAADEIDQILRTQEPMLRGRIAWIFEDVGFREGSASAMSEHGDSYAAGRACAYAKVGAMLHWALTAPPDVPQSDFEKQMHPRLPAESESAK